MKQMNGLRISLAGLLVSSLFIATACTDDTFNAKLSLPVVITSEVSAITQTSAICGGVISSDGGATVTQRGIIFNINPTIQPTGRATWNGSGAGGFTSELTELTPNTIYYVQAYAINSVGTSFGNIVSFTSAEDIILFNPDINYGTVTDIDGNSYRTVTIGTQTWMAENLKVTHYNDGNPIPGVTDNTAWSKLNTGAWCEYKNNPAYSASYGNLYNWHAVATGKLCPTGWHVPSDAEWGILSNYLGTVSSAGGKLKETGTIHWLSPNLDATNASGFTALPGGYRDNIGLYYANSFGGFWWTSYQSTHNAENARYRILEFDSGILYTNEQFKVFGQSVRCVKD